MNHPHLLFDQIAVGFCFFALFVAALCGAHWLVDGDE
jgi:hypothetical protein